MVRKTLLTIATVGAFFGAQRAIASTIDQQNTTQNEILSGSDLAGQSFTPALSSIDFATFTLYVAIAPGPSTVQINLLSGDGYGGSLLASTPSQVITNLGPQPIEFDFSSPVALTPGNIYTLQIQLVSGSVLNEYAASGNPYAGGQAYLSNGTVFTDNDLVFSEGTNPASAPEPATLSMLGLAALGMLSLRRFARR